MGLVTAFLIPAATTSAAGLTLPYEISPADNAVTIDGKRSEVATVPPDKLRNILRSYSSGWQLDHKDIQIRGCSAAWTYTTEFGLKSDVTGALCEVEHGGVLENAVLCDSIFADNFIQYLGSHSLTKHDLLDFMTQHCGGPDIVVAHPSESGLGIVTANPEMDLDERGIYEGSQTELEVTLAQHQISERLVSCELVVRLPVGVVGGNVSMGGVCTLERKAGVSRVAICTDEMGGDLEIKELGTRPMSSDELAIFTMAYCTA
jgi:hypothetical protein